MTSLQEFRCEICGRITNNPDHWFVIECSDSELTVLKNGIRGPRMLSELATSAETPMRRSTLVADQAFAEQEAFPISELTHAIAHSELRLLAWRVGSFLEFWTESLSDVDIQKLRAFLRGLLGSIRIVEAILCQD